MKRIKPLIRAAVVSALVWGASCTVQADMGAIAARDAVNAMNNNTGARFNGKQADNNSEITISGIDGFDFFNLDAYDKSLTATSNSFRTFTVDQMDYLHGNNEQGMLNYNGEISNVVTGRHDPNHVGNKTLTFGAAYLYTKFATGHMNDIVGFDYNHPQDTAELRMAILVAMDALINGSDNFSDWTATDGHSESNKFLQALMEINPNKNHWLGIYDPDQYYDELGDYSVFVINADQAGGTTSSTQDFLYLAKGNAYSAGNDNGNGNADYGNGGDENGGGSGAPEPASVLFWMLGGIAAIEHSWKRKRQIKLLAA